MRARFPTLALPVAAAQRLRSAVDDLADEIVLRIDQPVGHLHRGVEDLLPPGRPLAVIGSVPSTVSTSLRSASIAGRPASSDLRTWSGTVVLSTAAVARVAGTPR